VGTLIRQRVLGIALGYEDLNDHDELRRDTMLALLSDCRDGLDAKRSDAGDREPLLAGKSTLNRLELTAPDADASDRYKKIVADSSAHRPVAGGVV